MSHHHSHQSRPPIVVLIGLGLIVVAIILGLSAVFGFGRFAYALAFWPWIGNRQLPSADEMASLSGAAAWSFVEGPLALFFGWIGRRVLS